MTFSVRHEQPKDLTEVGAAFRDLRLALRSRLVTEVREVIYVGGEASDVSLRVVSRPLGAWIGQVRLAEDDGTSVYATGVSWYNSSDRTGRKIRLQDVGGLTANTRYRLQVVIVGEG